MIRSFVIPLILNCCIANSQQTASNKYVIKNSTITTVGSSNLNISEKAIKILQSIGQSSIIGTKKVNNYIVQQGFLNNSLLFFINNTDQDFVQEIITFKISPNPFVDFIKIDFAKKTANDIYISVFDVNGKIIINQKYSPTNKIILPLERISIGTYLINVKSGDNSSTKKILKEN